MRTLLMVATGVVFALAFDRVAAALAKRRRHGACGAGLFIWIWLAVVSVDFEIGLRAGNAVELELGAHLLIFIVPAALAGYLAQRHYPARTEAE
jgi:hypothetical protein